MGRYRGDGRITCESCDAIDVRQLHREGRLTETQSFLLKWTSNGAPSGFVVVRTEPYKAIFSYIASSDGSNLKKIEQKVPIVWSTCALGGRRPWFRCQGDGTRRHCGRRVAILYAAGEIFACRHCHGLAYATQQQSPTDRSYTRARKIRTQLGASLNLLEPIPEKPKGMHWRTYQRLRAQALAAEMATTAFLAEDTARQRQSLDRCRRAAQRRP